MDVYTWQQVAIVAIFYFTIVMLWREISLTFRASFCEPRMKIKRKSE